MIGALNPGGGGPIPNFAGSGFWLFKAIVKVTVDEDERGGSIPPFADNIAGGFWGSLDVAIVMGAFSPDTVTEVGEVDVVVSFSELGSDELVSAEVVVKGSIVVTAGNATVIASVDESVDLESRDSVFWLCGTISEVSGKKDDA